MTEIQLQKEIKKVLENDIIPKISLFGKGEMKVFLQDIPLDEEFEGEEDKYFPCCVVAFRGGKINKAGEPQMSAVEIIAAIRDNDADMSGYQSLVTVLNRIRDYFLANCGIDGKARMIHPIEWSINEDTLPGYFVGHIVTNWQTEVSPYVDIRDLI